MFHGESNLPVVLLSKVGKLMKELHLVSPIPPSVNHYLAYRVVKQRGRYVAMSYVTPEAKKYKREFEKYVLDEVKKQGFEHMPDKYQHVYVDGVFYFDRIDVDANNYWKVMLDAITETESIWFDDNVVCERVQGIYYDTANPRVELTIRPVDYIGIFDSAPQLEKFESNCIDCIRYSRNCSILQKAKEGRIQSEIEDGQCTKYTRRKGKKKGI